MQKAKLKEASSNVQRWLIVCDESGVDGSPYYGFGTLWMKYQRRGEFQGLVTEVRKRHGFNHEFKWSRVSRHDLAAYKDLVDAFFDTNWLCFQGLVVRRALVDKSFHDGDYDLARRKHFTMLLVDKMKRALRAHPEREHTFRIWVDPIASSYAKADEVVGIISNNVLKQVFGKVRAVDGVSTQDSKEQAAIQMVDVLIGAIVSAWRNEITSPAKLALRAHIAKRLGWEHLKGDTFKEEKKCNIWYFYPGPGDREAVTRFVRRT